MQLTRFVGEGLYRYLDVSLRFNRQLTFVTGINGSGKTTALNSIMALITPNLQELASIEFAKISVEFVNAGQKHFISAERDGSQVRLSCSGQQESIAYAEYARDPTTPSFKERDHEHEYYRDILSKFADSPVLKFISSLPTPMFLGLNRRAKGMEDLVGISRYSPRWMGARRNVFANTLSVGAREAVVLAETRYRDTLIAAGRIGDRLKRDMLYELLNVEESGLFGEISVPTPENIQQIAAMRERIDAIAEILDLPKDAVRKRMLPLLDKLLHAARRIPDGLDVKSLTSTSALKKDVLSALIDWSGRASQVRRIKTLSDMVERYNTERSDITESTDRYISMVEEYFRDSSKSVKFDENGYVSFTRRDAKTGSEISIDSLSSGEAQIFVILTNLFFHPQAQSDNVFIIDEPELSLHIQWQEMFVDSMMGANSNIQYIMATHSPSIIMEKVGSCEEVRPLRKARRRSA